MTPTWRLSSRTQPQGNSSNSRNFYALEEDSQTQEYSSSGVVANNVYDKSYVEKLRKSYATQLTERTNVRSSQQIGTDELDVRRRLAGHGHPCDLTTLTCLSTTCGRSFERVQVLAFHVSYAHQDLMTPDSNNLTCLLCGKKWTTVRRKILHLSLAHREIGEEHNSQCMLQVESVIAPNAPKAIRLEKARRIYDDGLDKSSVFDGSDPYLDETGNDEDEDWI